VTAKLQRYTGAADSDMDEPWRYTNDEEARAFYQKFDFIPSPADPVHLFVLLKDVRRIVSAQ
jgi:hypothetical protein